MAGRQRIAGPLVVDGHVLPLNQANQGWVDIIGQIVPFPVGAGRPTFTAWNAPHGAFYGWNYGIGDSLMWRGHVPHGVNAATGTVMHIHTFVDGTSVQPLRFEFEWSYAKGYAVQSPRAGTAFSTPQIVTVTQTPTGTPKDHMIIEMAVPILVDELEPDALIVMVVRRVTNGGTDNPDPVFVEFTDPHIILDTFHSTNRNYPFEP